MKLSDIKSTKPTNAVGEFIGMLFYSRNAAHLMHLKTTSFAAHKALDDYYSGIVGITDSLAESYQGVYGLINITIPSCSCGDDDPVSYFTELKQSIDTKRSLFKQSYHQNIIDEVLALVTSTIYKLKFLK
jgi:hypothetical protein